MNWTCTETLFCQNIMMVMVLLNRATSPLDPLLYFTIFPNIEGYYNSIFIIVVACLSWPWSISFIEWYQNKYCFFISKCKNFVLFLLLILSNWFTNAVLHPTIIITVLKITVVTGFLTAEKLRWMVTMTANT